MNLLLLGSGGRECALARKLSQSSLCNNLYIAPGNGGTAEYGQNVAIKPTDFEAVAAFAKEKAIDMIIPGNEDPLVAGITDYMRQHLPGVLVAGPSAAGARLEGSKDFAKQFMMRHAIPTAAYKSFTANELQQACDFIDTLQPPYVLKADGLAAGKGVLIIEDATEAKKALEEMFGGMFGSASATVVIEEFLKGIECSVFVITDGNGGYRLLPVAKDYKRIGEDDKGPNTGGMGAVSPVVFADSEFMKKVEERIVKPTVEGLKADGMDYRGFIFFGLINVDGEPMVIEYNVRMGDPETEVVMLRVNGDLVAALKAAAEGSLQGVELGENPLAAVTVMAVSAGYPGSYAKGKKITGEMHPADSVLFHAGTARDADGNLVTSGGRVIAVSSMAPTVEEALAKSYKSMDLFDFEGKTFRRDIGRDLLRLQAQK